MAFNLTPLRNLGNTCYMNVIIQALFATSEFRDYMLDSKSTQKLHLSLQKLFKDMIDCGESEEESLSPVSFRNTFIELKPQFADSKQQYDCQEFLRILIDNIHEEINEAKAKKKPENRPELKSAKDSWSHYIQYIDDSFLVKLFVGQLCSTIRCTKCDHLSECWDSFWDISLSLPEGDNKCSIKDCLKAYTADEVLDNDAMPTCPQCKTKQKSVKSLRIERSPLILTVNLKRFGNDGQKILKEVTVNMTLYLNSMPYDLFACVCHKGHVADTGHYNIYCRYESGKWYSFNDSSIKMVGTGDKLKPNAFSDAYILFYHMADVTIKH